jgi:hypothetical protein
MWRELISCITTGGGGDEIGRCGKARMRWEGRLASTSGANMDGLG